MWWDAIRWDLFDWQSFSTLAVGALTEIGAALIIALRQGRIAQRQTEISDRQTQILGRQAELGALSLRAELFERRFAVYVATRAYLGGIMGRGGKLPDQSLEQRFLRAREEAQFLFAPSLVLPLPLTAFGMTQANELFAHESIELHTFSTTGSFGGSEAVAAKQESFQRIIVNIQTLPSVFYELRLEDRNQSVP